MATIETQRQANENYHRQHFPNEAMIEFADDGVSSRVPFVLRPGSGALYREAEPGKVKVILVYALDRLGRDGDSIDTKTAVRQLWRMGVTRIISTQDGVAYEDTPVGRYMLDSMTSMGGFQRDINVLRSKEASRRLARDSPSMWLGGPKPFGYRQEGQDRQARLVIDDKEAEIVREIYKRFDEGQTYSQIVNYLIALGVPGAWDGRRVREIIRNRAYVGRISWGKRKCVWDDRGKVRRKAVPRDQWVERQCPAIVSEDVWQRANSCADELARAAKAHPRRDYPLSSLVRCETCGRAYVGAPSLQRDGSKKYYYRCSSHYRSDLRMRGVKCTNPSVRAQALDEAIWEYVAAFLAQPGLALEQLEQQLAAESQEGQNHSAELRKLEKRREALVTNRKRVLRQYGEGVFTDEEVKEEVQRIEAEMATLDKEREARRNVVEMAARATIELDWAGRLLSELRGQLLDGTLSEEKKRTFVATLVSSITITASGEARTVFRFDSDWQRLRQYRRKRAVREVSEQRLGHPCCLLLLSRPQPENGGGYQKRNPGRNHSGYYGEPPRRSRPCV
jgi:site-specific DNA recombinase